MQKILTFFPTKNNSGFDNVVGIGCTTFRLNPFRRIDNSPNTTIGLIIRVWYDITSKKIKDFRRIVAPVLFFGKEHSVVWGWD